MVICKYYQAGYCQYGKKCKFEHVDPNEFYDENYHQTPKKQSSPNYYRSVQQSSAERSSTPPTSPASFSFKTDPNRFRWTAPTLKNTASPLSPDNRRNSNPNTTSVLRNQQEEEPMIISPSGRRRTLSGKVYDEESLLRRVQEHIDKWRKSVQWPFSSYGFSGWPSMFEFVDFSQEEDRLRAYEARKENKMAEYKSGARTLLHGLQLKWDNYFHLTPNDRENMLKNLRPYIAHAESPESLAKKTDPAVKSKPSFSFKLQPENRPPQELKSSVNANRPAQREPKSSDPGKFSFKLPANEIRPPQDSKPSDPGKFSFKVPSVGSSVSRTQKVSEKIKIPVYTPVNELTPDELKAFEANEFTSFTEISTRPPPKELC